MACSTLSRSAGDNSPIFSRSRVLLTVANWSAIAFLCCPWSATKASLGYTRATLLVKGTTWARFKNWVDALHPPRPGA